jgi:hypothetical protein
MTPRSATTIGLAAILFWSLALLKGAGGDPCVEAHPGIIAAGSVESDVGI